MFILDEYKFIITYYSRHFFQALEFHVKSAAYSESVK